MIQVLFRSESAAFGHATLTIVHGQTANICLHHYLRSRIQFISLRFAKIQAMAD